MGGLVYIFLLTSVIFQLAFTSEEGILNNSILSISGSSSNSTGQSPFENGTEYPMLIREQGSVESSLKLTVSEIDDGTTTVSKNEFYNQSDSDFETISNFTDPTGSTSVTDFVDVDQLADQPEPSKSSDPSSNCPKDDGDMVVLFLHPTLPAVFINVLTV